MYLLLYPTPPHIIILIVKVKLNVWHLPLLPCLYSYSLLWYSYVLCISARHLNVAVLWKAYFEVYPWGVVLRVPPPMVAGHTSMGSAYALQLQYAHSTLWRSQMQRGVSLLSYGPVEAGHAPPCTWPDEITWCDTRPST